MDGSDRLSPAHSTDIILPSSPAYRAGPFGKFYLLSPNTLLIDVDSSTAPAAVGLFHYTTTTNLNTDGVQLKETNSWLDIGWHAVATDAAGKPLDKDGDGIADYLEDWDGDGVAESGETDWQTSENGTTTAPGLQVFTPWK